MAAEKFGKKLEHRRGEDEQDRQLESDAEHHQIDETQPGILVLKVPFPLASG
jgi:hypothetical protein